MGLKKLVKSVGQKVSGAAKSVGTAYKAGAKKFGRAAQNVIAKTPLGQATGIGGGGSSDGALDARAQAAKGLIRKARQGGAGIVSTMSQEE